MDGGHAPRQDRDGARREGGRYDRNHDREGSRLGSGGDRYHSRDHNPRERGRTDSQRDTGPPSGPKGDDNRGTRGHGDENKGRNVIPPQAKGEARDHGDGRRVRKPQRFQAQKRDRFRKDGHDDDHDHPVRANGKDRKTQKSRGLGYGIVERYSDDEMEDVQPTKFTPVGHKELKPETYEPQHEDEGDMDFLKRVMGFTGFSSTKNKQVPGNWRNYGANILRPRTYRQYMNRTDGFNRPLDNS